MLVTLCLLILIFITNKNKTEAPEAKAIVCILNDLLGGMPLGTG